jgi:ATP-binding cassette subfamily B protein
MNGRAKGAKRERPRGNGGLRRAVAYLGKQGATTWFAYGALVIATLAQLAVPKLVENMITSITQGFAAARIAELPELVQDTARTMAADQLNTTAEQLQAAATGAEGWLINATLLIIAFAVMRGIFAFVQAYMAEKTSHGIAYDLRNEIFAKIQRLSFSYHDRNQTGQLMIRATDDVEKVRLFLAQGLVLAVGALLLLVATLIILFATNWQLTLVILPILPLALVLFGTFGALSQPLFGEFQTRLSALNTLLQESVAGIKIIRAFTREQQQTQKFDGATAQLYAQSLKIGRTFAFLFPLIFLLAQVGQAVLLYFSGQLFLNNQVSLGAYQEFTLYLVYIFFPLGQLGFIISLLAQASASADRIFEILDAKNDVTDKPNALVLPQINGHVEFKDVTFRYFSSGAPVLSKVSFEAQPGQTIALLGATGSGKTTIINLIPRFYDASEGAILIDGHDVRDLSLDSLRGHIGIVLQETNLFSGTIRENIAFGRPEATLDEVMDAAKAAAAHDFIMTFPQGYDTPVGERGSTLSGGQKQRIAIARALLLDPHILILDDSTSSVDVQTEAQIQNALDHLMRGRTSFVIAQRITTVVNADQILVLDKGAIAARGTHHELMESSPVYADIYHSQLVGDAVTEGATS